MANKCVINRDVNGDIISVSTINKINNEKINEVRQEFYNRESAKKRAGKKIEDAIKSINSRTSSESNSKEIQKLELENWAKENDFWIEDVNSKYEKVLNGENSQIMIDPNNLNKVIKVTNNVEDINSWHESLINYNQLFPQTAYNVLGITRLSDNSLSIVTSQDFIPNKQIITDEEVQNYLEYIGFTREENSNNYVSEDVIIRNVDTNNVIKTTDGNYHIIGGDIDIVGDNSQVESGDININEETDSKLFKDLEEIPTLNREDALELYKQSFAKELKDWDELDLNC